MEPSPPITTMEMITNDVVGSKVMSVLLICWVAKAKQTPAYPATNPDNPKARSLVRRIGIPMAAAVTRCRVPRRDAAPTPVSRQIRTTKMDTSSTPRENQANERCEARLRPRNSAGRRVYEGLGSPVQSVLLMPGTVMHGVASTAFWMKMAKAKVVTARKSPGIRSAGSPTKIGDQRSDRTAVEHHQRQRHEVPRCTGDQRAHGHQTELPERHLARPAGEHVSDTRSTA